MTGQTREDLERELVRLEAELKERKNSIPIHSIRPRQLIEIEELEEAIGEIQRRLAQT